MSFFSLFFCECYFALLLGQFSMYLSLSRDIGVDIFGQYVILLYGSIIYHTSKYRDMEIKNSNNITKLGITKHAPVFGCRDESHDISDSPDQEFRRSEKRKKRKDSGPWHTLPVGNVNGSNSF